MPFPTIQVTPGSGTTINTLPNAGQAASANSLPVVVASDQSAIPANLSQIGGAAVGTSAAGVQKVGITGNTGAPIDCASAQNVPTAANMVIVGAEFNTTPTTITSGNSSPLQLDSAANLLVNVKTGAVTANAGVNLNTSALALESGGNLATVAANTATTNAGISALKALPVQGVTGGVAMPVSGTIGISGSSGAAVDAAGDNATAPANELIVGGVYNSVAPVLTAGKAARLQLDASGNLLASLKTALPAGSNTIGAVTQASGPWAQNITQIGGSTLALGQAAMTGSIPVAIANNQSSIPVSGLSAQLGINVSLSPTLASTAAYAAGNNVGGLLQFTFFRNTSQPSGLINLFSIIAAGGSAEAAQLTVLLFNKQPAPSFTDHATPTWTNADFQNFISPPLTLTPAAIASGVTAYAASAPLSLSVINKDSSATQKIYGVVIAGGTFTPSATGDFTFILSGIQD